MSSAAYEHIRQGLQEAIAHARGDARGVRVYRPRAIDVKSVRAKAGMTQTQFAPRFGFSAATLRHWERGERNPRAVVESLA
ncbi:MAG: helix-turn-helix domain-containing protein [Burkholderiaceae bacterium]|jgi:putative transcriptional regulator|nr:helix-turn-helix domain-containing protein [Burkholderiaceae bacterium]